MKKTAKKSKKVKGRKETKNIALRIVGDFMKYNGICFLVLVTAYVIVYLFLLQWPDLYTDLIRNFLIDLFG